LAPHEFTVTWRLALVIAAVLALSLARTLLGPRGPRRTWAATPAGPGRCGLHSTNREDLNMKKPLTGKTAAATALASTLVLSASVGAAGYGKDGDMQKTSDKGADTGVAEMSFKELDTDGDGYISQWEVQQNSDLSEMRPEMLQRWDQFDGDQDGRLTKSEFSAFEELQRGDKQQREGTQQQERTQQEEGTQKQQ
jgi:Ca2+-binding EF-hand superfamily protein